jgi:oxygen-independent coproporphyrinogen-3 oxidase
LIFGVPGESTALWASDLQQAMDLQPDHLSIYGLTFEKGTTFWGRLLRGVLTPIDEETQRQMFELAMDRLVEGGWKHYEVSNFARPGHRCRHNEVYWRGDSYFGFGPGASRYVDGCRETNHRSTTTYLRRVFSGESPVAESEQLAPLDRAREQLVLGLRMMSGVSRKEFFSRTGFDLEAIAGEPLRKFLNLGLLQEHNGCLRLTREGLMISDALWPELL